MKIKVNENGNIIINCDKLEIDDNGRTTQLKMDGEKIPFMTELSYSHKGGECSKVSCYVRCEIIVGKE